MVKPQPTKNSNAQRRVAFTLAEVLITLGIIGVVAAMTLPTLIQKYQNKVVETKLAKFYTTINQAIKLAEVQYGDKKYWYQSSNSYETDPDTGEVIQGSSEVEKWWKKYIAPNMPTVDIKYDKENLPIFYFKDGSALKAQHTNAMTDWVFYTINPEKCEALSDAGGRCRFLFIYMPAGDGGYIQGSVLQYTRFKYHLDRGMEPYKWCWDGKRETLLSGNISCSDGSESGYLGCNSSGGTHKAAYCTTLIQLNGWKIPKDYPFKVLGF